MRLHELARMLVIGAIASVAGIAIALAIDWFPVQASTQAGAIDLLYDILLIVSVPVFVLVMTVVLYCVWRFRVRPGQEDKDGAPIHGNTALEVVWTVLPALLLFGLMAYTLIVLSDIEAAEPDTTRVNVTGQQFTWSFEYPGLEDADGEPLQSNELMLERDVPVEFFMNSNDVIHSFWIPAMRMKRDVVPGLETTVRMTPNRDGSYAIVCAELCGVGHSVMRQTVVVMDSSRFSAWVDEQSESAVPEDADPAQAGAQVFTAAGCGACHTLADAGTNASTGPDLDDALAGMSEEQIRESIVDPNAEIAEGFSEGVMPQDFGETLSDDELEALVTYLAEQSQ